MVTVYKNIMSNEDFTPYAIKTKRLFDNGPDDPCQLDQSQKSNLLSCELYTMLQKRLRAHDQGQKYIDVGDSFCNCDNLKKPCDALEKLHQIKEKVDAEIKKSKNSESPGTNNKNSQLT